MCYVTYLDCQVCKVKDKYVFHPCESFAEEHVDLARNGPLPSRKRFHCPELALPLPEDENSSHHICDLCLRNGIIYYQRTVVIEQQTQFNERYHASMYPAVQQSPPTPDIVEVDEDYQEDREEGELDYSSDDDQAEIRLFPRSFEIEGKFPPNWEHLSQRFKASIRDTYCTDKNKEQNPQASVDKDKALDKQWQHRLADEPYRMLTLWFPCCTICKKPSFNHNGGIDGVEIEPSPMFWKWLKRLQGEKLITTRIETGFIHKPCQACINKEVELRLKVTHFLSLCSNPAAWAVWQWLMMRGTSWVPFWKHEAPNVALPDAPPWDSQSFLQLMATGWKAKSGVAWENTVELDPPVSCSVVTSLHQEPFLDLSQWNNFAGVPGRRDPTVQPPTRPTQARSPPHNEANQLVEIEDESEQESEDELRQESREPTPPLPKIPDCPEVAIGEIRTLRQWNAKQQGKRHGKWLPSLDNDSKHEQPRFFTVRGAVIDCGHAVNAFRSAQEYRERFASDQRKLREEQAASNQAPVNLSPPEAGDVVEPARPSRKRQASSDTPDRKAKRARPDAGSADGYPSPSTAPSGGSSSQEPGTPHIPTYDGASSRDVFPEHNEDNDDLFGNNEINPRLASSPAINGAAVTSADGRADRNNEVKGAESKNTPEDFFCSCGHGFWRVNGLEPNDRWSLELGFEDDGKDVEY